MAIPGWAVSAAILLQRKQGLSIYQLTEKVLQTKLSGVGQNARKVQVHKILWSQITKNSNVTHWFRAQNNFVELIERELASNDSYVAEVVAILNRRANSQMPALPEEIDLNCDLHEGRIKTISVNAFERNPIAREQCIVEFGARCGVCKVDFSERYGIEFLGLIHVHHLKPLASIRQDYAIDPLTDLCPICPNCHAVIHWKGKCRSIKEVQMMLKSNQKHD